MEEILQTERLRIRQFSLDDALFMMNLTNTEDWLKNIGDRNTNSEDLAKQYLENGNIKSYRERGYGGYLVELKESGEPVGMCGLFKRDVFDHPDIGFAFLPEHYGKGYGFEAASAVLKYALEELRLPKVLGITLPSNTGSVRLLEKIGLRCTGKVRMPGDDEELLLFSS
ncbi:MAG TPA: GNAT family N-acetyltransferase [Chitinophagaceae bacterium]|nr:GNAT family N-acetyltransferase [Chitinophagaceae bacterium]